MKQLAAFVAGLVVTGVVVLMGPGQASSGTRPVTAKPRCDAGDLIMTMTASRREGSARARTPEQAVRAEVTSSYPSLSPDGLRKGPVSSSTADFAFERAGRPLASVRVAKIGSGWGVERLTACNSVLAGSRKR